MNRWRFFCASIILGTLCACAAQQETRTTVPPAPATPVAKAPPVQIASLPCAEVDNTHAVTIRYRGENLYYNGAILPKEEGLACLEVLADWLKGVPQSRWQMSVAGEGDHGFDPLALAGKRQELLQRFFTRKGIEIQSWQWQTVAGQGVQLELSELKDLP